VRALLSCSDKSGVIEFASGLSALGYELVSTGGTKQALEDAGQPVLAVADVTGFPEILDGRVKTLHPKIHGGILARADDANHQEQLARHGIAPIQIVVSNLYPLERAVRSPEISFAEAIEEIDIGGPAMVRAAAKNHESVLIVTDPADYAGILGALNMGSIDLSTRRRLAAKAFTHVATYDSLVAAYLSASEPNEAFPEELAIGLRRARTLRYGENPHQAAAAYRRLRPGLTISGILDAQQQSGGELSFNNLLDADAAWRALEVAAEPTVSIVKHAIPCGLASRPEIGAAFVEALAGDPVSAFGGIVALNRSVDDELAQTLSETRFDIIVAPEFTLEARAFLGRRRSLRLLELAAPSVRVPASDDVDLRVISGGLLVQTADTIADDLSVGSVVTDRSPTEGELRDLAYAWRSVRYVKSNGIVLVKSRAVVGVGSGQPNRLESVAIAAKKAGSRTPGSSLASDAYFPFADGVETAAELGVSAIVQPGGSIRDAEVIAAANTAGIAMICTGVRHFRH